MTYLLFLQGGHVAANGSQAGELRVFPYDPFDELAQRQQQSVPVFRVALEPIPENDRERNT